MTKIFIEKPINADLLVEQLETEFPGVQPAMFWLHVIDGGLYCLFPDELDINSVWDVINLHDPNQKSKQEQTQQKSEGAIIGFKNLPTWATITPSEAHDHIIQNVWAGQNESQINSWIDANVTNLAQAKTALKQLSSAIISLRDMEARLAQAIIYLRDLTVK